MTWPYRGRGRHGRAHKRSEADLSQDPKGYRSGAKASGRKLNDFSSLPRREKLVALRPLLCIQSSMLPPPTALIFEYLNMTTLGSTSHHCYNGFTRYQNLEAICSHTVRLPFSSSVNEIQRCFLTYQCQTKMLIQRKMHIWQDNILVIPEEKKS